LYFFVSSFCASGEGVREDGGNGGGSGGGGQREGWAEMIVAVGVGGKGGGCDGGVNVCDSLVEVAAVVAVEELVVIVVVVTEVTVTEVMMVMVVIIVVTHQPEALVVPLQNALDRNQITHKTRHITRRTSHRIASQKKKLCCVGDDNGDDGGDGVDGGGSLVPARGFCSAVAECVGSE
jgi:hypothetical protein